MILVRSPLRISLGGGGTDLPSFYNRNGGFVLSAAIDKYIYVAINRPFTNSYILKYSQYESVEQLVEIQHPIIREALKIYGVNSGQIEISSMADIPAGTGLGSSGSFTTALLKGLSTYCKKPIHAKDLAELACEIEIDILNEPIGKQDQYIAAYGGFTAFNFLSDGQVKARSIDISESTIHELEDNLLLFYTGKTRSASSILKDQDQKTALNEMEMINNLSYIKDLGLRAEELLVSGECEKFGLLMNEHWEYKRSRSEGISNLQINNAYSHALLNGAVGGKLVGAGGGGFLMFYASAPEKLRFAMLELGLEEVRFKFDFQGTSVVIS